MKKKNLLAITMMLIFVFALNLQAKAPAEDLLGKWKYTVSNVDPEYQKGVMTFEQKDDKTVGYLGLEKKLEMKDLKIEKQKITFKLILEGGVITVNLSQSEGKLMGKVVTEDGEFPMVAEKEEKK